MSKIFRFSVELARGLELFGVWGRFVFLILNEKWSKRKRMKDIVTLSRGGTFSAKRIKSTVMALFASLVLCAMGAVQSVMATSISVVSTSVTPSGTGSLTIQIDNARGDEIGFSFTLSYDSSVIQLQSTPTEASGTSGAGVTATIDQERQGKYGIQWGGSNPATTILSAGTSSLLTIPFDALGVGGTSTTISIVSDANVQEIAVSGFTPPASILDITSEYTVQSGTVSIIDPRTDPNLSWADPSAITYGTSLTDVLNATVDSSVSGTIAYAESSTTITTATILAAGTHTLTATFTPTDDTAVQPATKSVTLVVNQAPLTITAPTLQATKDSTFPTITLAFSGFVNGEDETDVGSPTFVLSPNVTDTTTLGEHSIIINGGTSSNYAITKTNGTLSIVDKLVPTVTWATPAAISYGTPLSATQLNASSTTASTTTGTPFVYTPSADTVLDAGLAQTLSVTFCIFFIIKSA